LNRLLDGQITRIVHAGNGNFTFHFEDGRVLELAESQDRLDFSMRAYVELADIAMTAQIAFLMTHAPTH
jgi:hypothetical protein